MNRYCYLAIFYALLFVPRGATEKHGPDESQFTIAGVTIGHDDIASLRAKLGPVRKCHTRHHVEIAGYSNANEELIFEFGEVGGGDVTAFYLRPKELASECPTSKLQGDLHELSTNGGVHIGMSSDKFLAAFGPPASKTKDGEWQYSWNWEQPLTEEEKSRAAAVFPGEDVSKGEVSVSVRVRFSLGVLRYFYISKLGVL